MLAKGSSVGAVAGLGSPAGPELGPDLSATASAAGYAPDVAVPPAACEGAAGSDPADAVWLTLGGAPPLPKSPKAFPHVFGWPSLLGTAEGAPQPPKGAPFPLVNDQ